MFKIIRVTKLTIAYFQQLLCFTVIFFVLCVTAFLKSEGYTVRFGNKFKNITNISKPHTDKCPR